MDSIDWSSCEPRYFTKSSVLLYRGHSVDCRFANQRVILSSIFARKLPLKIVTRQLTMAFEH